MATQVERHINSEGTPGSALEVLEEHIQKNSVEMEQIFKDLLGITGTLGEHSLREIVSCHARFLELLSPIMKKSKVGRSSAVRSFVAKYMHFHNPLVPIYDNENKKSLNELTKLCTSEMEHRDSPKNADHEYFAFGERLRCLASELKLELCACDIRNLDHYLRVKRIQQKKEHHMVVGELAALSAAVARRGCSPKPLLPCGPARLLPRARDPSWQLQGFRGTGRQGSRRSVGDNVDTNPTAHIAASLRPCYPTNWFQGLRATGVQWLRTCVRSGSKKPPRADA